MIKLIHLNIYFKIKDHTRLYTDIKINAIVIAISNLKMTAQILPKLVSQKGNSQNEVLCCEFLGIVFSFFRFINRQSY
jgi:hypothetical protein